jgi:hypothetical protein
MVNRVAGFACVVVLGLGVVLADNFEVHSGRKGCESIVKDSERRDCQDLSRRKNDACNVSASCDMDRHKRDIDEYNDAKSRLASGKIADADKSRLEQTIRELKDKLDARKSAAPDVMKIAQNCIDMRAKVQEWFKGVAIPLTERARDDAMRLRRELLEKLKEADERRQKAKEKRDANPNDSSAKDDHERAATAHRDAEKALEAFNDKYGRDVERHAGRLIDQYKEERDRHDEPTKQAESRLQRCKDLVSLSY